MSDLVAVGLDQRVSTTGRIKVEGLRLSGFSSEDDRAKRQSRMIVTDLTIKADCSSAPYDVPRVMILVEQLVKELRL
jgi:hypothetical protein